MSYFIKKNKKQTCDNAVRKEKCSNKSKYHNRIETPFLIDSFLKEFLRQFPPLPLVASCNWQRRRLRSKKTIHMTETASAKGTVNRQTRVNVI